MLAPYLMYISKALAKQTASARNQEHLQGSGMRKLMGLQAAGWRVAEFKCSRNQNELLEYLQKILVLVNLEESLWKNNSIDFTRSLSIIKTCVWPHLTPPSSGSKLGSIHDIRYAVQKSELPSIHCLPMIPEQTAQLAIVLMCPLVGKWGSTLQMIPSQGIMALVTLL